jgi:2-polyprenyl-6-methoxyphenol hydroxylase-like FAD-dependent oxidoreductase
MSKATKQLGERAIVLGAGIAGSLVARVLADHFTQVTVIERDSAADPDGFRKGVPQAKLVHGLLRGGLDAMNAVFPELEQELYARGSVRAKPARDLLFVDFLGAWPRFDVGLEIPLVSRPPLEQSLRSALARVRNVELRERTAVRELISEGEHIRGVLCKRADGTTARELADLIVDATGRAAHTGEWLTRLGFPAPEQTRVDVDIAYAGCFVRPRRTSDLLGALVSEPSPKGRYGCLIQAQEGERMIVGVSCRGGGGTLPADFASVVACAERLPHPGAFDMLRDAEPLSEVTRFGFPTSVHRHYERLSRLPEGFLCIGDALCSFNPVWGQGMSVAALEVVALRRMLEERAAGAASLSGLPAGFYAEAARIIATAWQLSVVPDFSFDTTRGERPDGLSAGRGFMRAFAMLARQDPAVRALLNSVYHLVDPLEALKSPEIVAKVLPLLQAASPSSHP